jgi:hypothetical protein
VGQEEPSEVFASVRRDGKEAVVALEIDPERSDHIDLSKLTGRMRGGDGEARPLVFERVGEHRYEARTRLSAQGIALGTVALGDGRTIRLPPVTLPYSPEFERGADSQRGERTLRRLASESGGIVNPAAADLFRGERTAKGWRPIVRELTLLALILLLLEIAVRRLELASFVRVPAPVVRAWQSIAARRRVPAPIAAGSARPTPVAPADTDSAAKPAAPTPPPTVESALAQARKAAGRRLER